MLMLSAAAAAAEEVVGIYEIKRGSKSFNFTNFGASMLGAILPDKHGKLADVVLGFPTVNSYKNDTTYFGNIVGRVANRIGAAKFKLDGTLYQLVPNDGKNLLHGGSKGYGEVIWKVSSYNKDSHVTFTYDSFDGEEGFPGEVSVKVTYMLMGQNSLGVKMVAKPKTKATPINLALHTYWNLGGHNNGNILNHTIQIFGSKITPVDNDKDLIPTGDIISVTNTPFDFSEAHQIGSRIKEVAGGYDINYVLNDINQGRHFNKVAVVKESVSGRKMELWTNKPGVQFYTGNMLDDVKGKDESVYSKYAGFCLETQGFPDAVNHPNFPTQIVNPGDTYHHFMVYRFTA
ncbi:Galactose mutarotase-like superfamily protein [Euphorbia peplus]|nr:Galactose mutarotase-like superfamily protein [Euphorbia peplus]